MKPIVSLRSFFEHTQTPRVPTRNAVA